MVFQLEEGPFFHLQSSIVHSWLEESFFFASSSSPWGFPSWWGDPRIGPNENSLVDTVDQEDFLQLKNIEVPPQRELMTEQALYDAGLSSIISLGIT